MAWSDAEFLAEVQRRFGFRLGRFLKVGPPRAVSAVADPRGAHQCGALRHHRQCGAGPASGRRHGFQPWVCAMWRASPSSSPSTAASRRSIPGAASLLARVRCLARGGSRRRHRLHRRAGAAVCQSLERGAAAAQSRDCWRSTCCRRRRRRCRALSTGRRRRRVPKLARGVALR